MQCAGLAAQETARAPPAARLARYLKDARRGPPVGRPRDNPPEKKMTMQTILSAKQKEAIEACAACAHECEACTAECLEAELVADMVACLSRCIDCADVCRLTATLLARRSGIAPDMCRVCLEMCLRCEEECAKHRGPSCKACADACSACEEALREIS